MSHVDSMAPPAEIVPPEPPPLRRNGRFQLVWIGAVAGQLGGEAAAISYPLIILAITGSPARAGLFAFVLLLANLICAMPGGAIVDRVDRRRLLLVTEGARVVVAASVALALAHHDLTMAHLIVAAAVLGAAAAVSTPARMLFIRSVVPDQQLTAALTQEEVRDNAATLAGPSLGGLLYGLRTLLPFVASAIGYAISWICVLLVRMPSAPTPAAEETAGNRSAPRCSSGCGC